MDRGPTQRAKRGAAGERDGGRPGLYGSRDGQRVCACACVWHWNYQGGGGSSSIVVVVFVVVRHPSIRRKGKKCALFLYMVLLLCAGLAARLYMSRYPIAVAFGGG